MKTCQDWELDISAYIDGVLSGEERAALLAHIDGCPACRQCLDDQLAIHEALHALAPLPAPEGLAERVMEQVRESEQGSRKRTVSFPRWRRWAALAACCAVVALGVWRVQGGREAASMDAAAPLLQSVPQEAALESGTDASGAALQAEEPDSRAAGQPEEYGVLPAPAYTPEDTLCDEADASGADGAEEQKAARSGPELVDYETAKTLFGHPLVPCAADNFEGYYLGWVSGSPGGEMICTNANYCFSNGDASVRDQDREGSLPVAEDYERVVSQGETFYVRDASLGGGRPVVLYLPNGETGLAYSARFDSSVDQSEVFELLLALKIG